MWWTNSATPVLVYSNGAEHTGRGGGLTALRHMAQAASVQGVQQIYIDAQRRLYSTGADCSLKLRPLPTLLNETV